MESSDGLESSEVEVAESLANVQLPVVGVNPSSSDVAEWKSPKSPKLSNDESSSEKEDGKLKGSTSFVAAAASENGPKPS